MLVQQDTSYLDYERDKTLAEQRAEALERERSMEPDRRMHVQSAINESRTQSA